MNKLEELLKDWVLDDKALEAQREIFARVPVSRHHEMDLRHKLSDFIKKSPKKPDKLFEALSLPVDRIKVDSISGSGFKRSFERGGKRFTRPEFVAKDFYEAQGYKVSWSEGVAFGMALDAILYELADRLKGHFRVIPGRIYTDAEIEEIRNGQSVAKDRIIELNEREKNRPTMLESGGKDAAQVLSLAFHALLSGNKCTELFEETINKHLGYDCSLSELQSIFFKTLTEVTISEPSNVLTRWLPVLDELKKDGFRDKWNYTEWSIAFAKELLDEFPRKSFHEHILKTKGFNSQRFDLSLFDHKSGEIRFVEVKLDDTFTKMQINDLEESIHTGLNIGIAVIEAP